LVVGRWSFVLSGLFLGAAVYAHPASRFIPFVLAGYAAWLAWADRPHWRRCLGGLVLTGLVALALSLPLARFFWLNRTALLGHPGDVSILASRVNQGDLVSALLDNAVRVAGMFVWRGDEFWTHNLAGRPVFDPLTGLAFLLGLGLSLVRVARRPRDPTGGPFVLALLWLAVMLLPTLLSDQTPNFSRAIGAIPAVFLFPALGLEWSRDKVTRWQGDKVTESSDVTLSPGHLVTLSSAIVVAVVALSGGLTVRDYFGTFAAAPQAYYDYDQDKADAVAYLRTAARDHTVYLAPLWATQATVVFLSRDFEVRSFEPSHTLVLPPTSPLTPPLPGEGKGEGSGRSALYAVPAEQGPQSAALGEWLGSLAAREDVADRYGRPLLTVFRLPADRLPNPPDVPFGDPRFAPAIPVRADFGGQVQLLGYTTTFDVERSTLNVTLFWRALQPMRRNYTIFVHLLDGVGQRWGQADAEPGGGSYRTSAWVPGELIIDRVTPAIDRCAPDGTYLLSVGVYELSSGERLTISEGSIPELEENQEIGDQEIGDQGPESPIPDSLIPRLQATASYAGLAALDLGPVRVKHAPLPADAIAPQHRLNVAAGPDALTEEPTGSEGRVRLIGYDGGPWTLRPGDRLPITLYWQWGDHRPPTADGRPLTADRGLSLRLVGADGVAQPLPPVVPPDAPSETRFLQENGFPGTTNVVTCQALRPRLPTHLARGDYRLEIIPAGGPPAVLGSVTVQAPDRSFQLPSPQHPVSAEFGDQMRLLGYDLELEENQEISDQEISDQGPDSPIPDSLIPRLRVTLYWQAVGEMQTGYTVFVHLLDGEGKLRAQHDGPPAGGDWPTTAWTPGEIVRDEHSLTVPADVPPGRYALAVGLYDPRTLRRLALTAPFSLVGRGAGGEDLAAGSGDQVTLPGAVEVR
jgi:hypothetical protein